MPDEPLTQRTEARFNTNEPVRRIVDSTVMMTFARFVMPIAITIIGYFVVTSISDFKDQNARMWVAIAKMSGDIQANSISATVTDLRLKENAKAFDEDRKRLDDHEARLRELARTQAR